MVPPACSGANGRGTTARGIAKPGGLTLIFNPMSDAATITSLDGDNEQTTSILITAFPPFPTMTLSLPSATPISKLYDHLRERYPSLPPSFESSSLVFRTHAGSVPSPDATLSSLHTDDAASHEETGKRRPPPLVALHLLPKLLGNQRSCG